MNKINEKLELKKAIKRNYENNRKLLPQPAQGVILTHIVSSTGKIIGRGADALAAMRDALCSASNHDSIKNLLTSGEFLHFIDVNPYNHSLTN